MKKSTSKRIKGWAVVSSEDPTFLFHCCEGYYIQSRKQDAVDHIKRYPQWKELWDVIPVTITLHVGGKKK